MNKPNAYDETQSGGEFTPVELGGHKLVIKQVNETKSKTGKDMIVVLFDFAEDDKQPGYFMEQFQNDIRPNKKWPNQATQYILTEDAEGKCTRNFKTFTTCAEHSNAGFSVQWGRLTASISTLFPAEARICPGPTGIWSLPPTRALPAPITRTPSGRP